MAILLMSNLPPSQLEKEAGRLGTEGWTPKAHKPEQLRQAVRDVLAAPSVRQPPSVRWHPFDIVGRTHVVRLNALIFPAVSE